MKANVSHPSPILPADIEERISQERLLRILRSDLRQSIRQKLALSRDLNPYVLQDAENVYLSLENFADARQRHTVYQLIQRLQVGDPVDLSQLPTPLRQLLQPEPTQLGLFFQVVVFGAAVGMIIGVMGMAMGLLGTAVYEWITKAKIGQIMGMDTAVLLFLVFGILGWAGTAMMAWQRKTA